jgi:hypothetical protein
VEVWTWDSIEWTLKFTCTVLILFVVVGSSYYILLLSTLVYGISVLIFDHWIVLLTAVELSARVYYLGYGWLCRRLAACFLRSDQLHAGTFLADARFLAPGNILLRVESTGVLL